MSALTTSSFLTFSPVVISDWLPKIGEKAFLAWLKFRTWMEESPDSSPSLLTHPLSKLIKRLKVGNSTFYNQILRPLWNYGLVDLIKAPGIHQYQLMVYSSPKNSPENATHLLTKLRDYNVDFQAEVRVEQSDDSPSENTTLTPTEPTKSKQPSEDDSDEHPYPSKDQPLNLNLETPLPTALSNFLQKEPSALGKEKDILRAYQKCKDHPRYTDHDFIRKIRDCLGHPRKINHFAAYLLKAILNEWNKPSSQPISYSDTHHHTQQEDICPPDMPIYVWEQIKNPHREVGKLTPEQEAQLLELKIALGEV